MAKVELTESFRQEVDKIFKAESVEVLKFISTLEENPKKGKNLTNVGEIVIKELKYKTYRFYFITNGFKLKFLKVEELKDLVIKFVRLSKKNNQTEIIKEIKLLLNKLGYEAF